jgi:hypothetical protein
MVSAGNDMIIDVDDPRAHDKLHLDEVRTVFEQGHPRIATQIAVALHVRINMLVAA